MPVSLLVARDLGRLPGLANFQDEAELGTRAGCGHHRDDAARVEQRRSAVDSGLGVVLASVVSGRDGKASWLKGWIGKQRRPMERRASGTTNKNVVEARSTSTGLTCEMWLVRGGRHGE